MKQPNPIAVLDVNQITEIVDENEPENNYAGCLWRLKNIEKVFNLNDSEINQTILTLSELNGSLKNRDLGKLVEKLSALVNDKKYLKIAENLVGIEKETTTLFNSTEFYKMCVHKVKFCLDKKEEKMLDDYEAFGTLIDRVETENEMLHNSVNTLSKKASDWEKIREK